jgi:hypothetical protein
MTNFTIEHVLEQSEAVGMNRQLREAIHYNYGESMGRYLELHPKGTEPDKYRDKAAMAWGYLAGRQTIKAYVQRSNK